jgi:GT2 family glycosyltransferase
VRKPRSKANDEGAFEHSYVEGSYMLLATGALAHVGFFDDIFHTYYEEIDLCRRMRWAGFKVALLPWCLVEHERRGLSRERYSRGWRKIRSRHYYLATEPTLGLKEYLVAAGRSCVEDARIHPKPAIPWWLLMHIAAAARLVAYAPYVVAQRRSRVHQWQHSQTSDNPDR